MKRMARKLTTDEKRARILSTWWREMQEHQRTIDTLCDKILGDPVPWRLLQEERHERFRP